ncbi:MAG: RNA-binding protein [Propionibacteriaceae bacterium]
MLSDALEHLVRGIVTNPDDVQVRDKDVRQGRMLEVRVNPEDIGKVIGRNGRTATALRTVVTALAGRDSVRIDFVDVDRRDSDRRGGGRGGRGGRPRR